MRRTYVILLFLLFAAGTGVLSAQYDAGVEGEWELPPEPGLREEGAR